MAFERCFFGAVGIGPCYFDEGLSLCDDLGGSIPGPVGEGKPPPF